MMCNALDGLSSAIDLLNLHKESIQGRTGALSIKMEALLLYPKQETTFVS